MSQPPTTEHFRQQRRQQDSEFELVHAALADLPSDLLLDIDVELLATYSEVCDQQVVRPSESLPSFGLRA